MISYYYYLSLRFQVEHGDSVARLHFTLFSSVFSTWHHDCLQPFISSSYHLPHVTLALDTQLIVSALDSTRRPGLARDVPSWSSQCMPNPFPLSSSAYLLDDRFLIGLFPEFLVVYSFWPPDLQYRVSVDGCC
ncbi:unnamed protein product [Heterobilharzia americana]|nr:unnamed protein product [Heterobilharzia americana]